MGVIHEKLVQAGFLQSSREEATQEEESNKDYCQYHFGIQIHGIQERSEFREMVQDLMDKPFVSENFISFLSIKPCTISRNSLHSCMTCPCTLG